MFDVSVCGGNGYGRFTKLDPKKCIKADATVMSQLPSDWQKYKRFVKICPLTKNKINSDVSIISIWVNEYFDAKYPPLATHQWEQFPAPVIMDKMLHKIGSLPELFPDDDITSSIVYYGKWHGGIPTEIRVDVENPAEGGDYYYSPIVYNSNNGVYEPKNKEIIHGKRH